MRYLHLKDKEQIAKFCDIFVEERIHRTPGLSRGIFQQDRGIIAEMIVAIDSDKPIGWAMLLNGIASPNTKMVYDLHAFVMPNYRLQGIGRHMVSQITKGKKFEYDEFSSGGFWQKVFPLTHTG